MHAPSLESKLSRIALVLTSTATKAPVHTHSWLAKVPAETSTLANVNMTVWEHNLHVAKEAASTQHSEHCAPHYPSSHHACLELRAHAKEDEE